MRPRCSILTGDFDFSGCGDCTSCPPIEQAEISNSEPSPIVLPVIPCMCRLYAIRMEKTVRSRFAAIHPFQIAHEVSNWLGIARREPGLRDRKVSQIACSSARGADDSCRTPKGLERSKAVTKPIRRVHQASA